tara:strand:+ start:40316 stop:41632 length:1317 start_codon:yes stop_codon:yes gene_type:complete
MSYEGVKQREAAWYVLLYVAAGSYSDIALQRVLNKYNFSSKDISLVTELAYGSIRYRKYLDTWMEFLTGFTVKQQPPKLRWLLHIGLYQILKMNRIPDSAAIFTTVEVAKRSELKKMSNVVNAILRSCSRKQLSEIQIIRPLDQIDQVVYKYSLPKWLVEEMICWFGLERTKQLAKSFNRTPTIDLRINRLLTNLDFVQQEFIESKVLTEKIKGINSALTLKTKTGMISNLPGYKEGNWSVQDRSSQLIATLLSPQPGEKILDACAAPGGKSTHIAELIDDDGEIWAVDKSKIRLKKILANIERLQISCIKVLNANSIDLINLKPNWINYFDKIIIDAPCSCLGTLARNPDARWRITKRDINDLIKIQSQLLDSLVPLLRRNGKLIYSTCTINPFENKNLIDTFLEKHNQFSIILERHIFPDQELLGDGFYAALLGAK